MPRVKILGRVARLIIGEAPQEDVAQYVSQCGVESFNLAPSEGVWKGERESCTILTIAGMSWRQTRILARALAIRFSQDCIYVEYNNTALLVYQKEKE